VNREPTNISAREEDGCDNEGVSSERQSRSPDGEHGLIVQLIERRIAKGRKEDLVDQIGGELAAATVAKNDPFVVEDRDRTRTERRQTLANDLLFRLQIIFSGWHVCIRALRGA
jgi:hypothetical protein